MSVEDRYAGVLLIWHGRGLKPQFSWPAKTPNESPLMVTLVHWQVGIVWHDEVGHGGQPQGSHMSAVSNEVSAWSRRLQWLFGFGRFIPKEFYIRVYPEEEAVRIHHPKQTYPHYFELAIEEMLESGGHLEHDSVAKVVDPKLRQFRDLFTQKKHYRSGWKQKAAWRGGAPDHIDVYMLPRTDAHQVHSHSIHSYQ